MEGKLLLPLFLAFAVIVSGCTAPPVTPPPSPPAPPAGPETGTLFLQITDQPALDIEKADVTISMVQVHKALGENESNETESGWITVVAEPQTFDLIAIKYVKEFLGSNELDAGRYTQIRLTVDKAEVTINGTVYNLTVPSEKIRLVKNFEIEANETTTLILDFVANKSIHSAGQSGRFILRPTIRIIEAEAAAIISSSATCSGTSVTIEVLNAGSSPISPGKISGMRAECQLPDDGSCSTPNSVTRPESAIAAGAAGTATAECDAGASCTYEIIIADISYQTRAQC